MPAGVCRALPLVLFSLLQHRTSAWPADESFRTWLKRHLRSPRHGRGTARPALRISWSVLLTRRRSPWWRADRTETVTFTIHNAGDGEADSTTATIRASGDSTIATNDNQIGDTLAVPRLAASDSTRLAISFSAPAGLSPQVLYVGMCVEPVSGESDTDNNCSSAVKVTVVAGVTRLTNNAADDYQPAWSPDGSRVAFVSERDNIGGDVHVMGVDGDRGDESDEPLYHRHSARVVPPTARRLPSRPDGTVAPLRFM